ncbi:antitoxin [Phytoactinopolyspora endophytica]|uniref:antitoxin n=1 Tax=Phytoactinopolyspora endophytica TaxID=1642495 RepID=UPI00101BAF1E|nr:antitoxin [Phytoactinopolyspora endophytica]
MGAETATLRVSRETRDLLAEQAQERGLSISALLAEMAGKARRESFFRAERAAVRNDAAAAEVQAEEAEWEATLSDGID